MSFELLIDSSIRKWVLIPIVIITFLVEYIRHHVALLLTKEKQPTLQQVQDSQAIIRARLLREHGNLLPLQSYQMRWHYLADPTTGYFNVTVRQRTGQNVISLINDLTLNNLVNYFPMIALGGWINWMFSGFVTTCIPFPLTLRFKPMLQRGLEVTGLGASWVSSASWYFVNVFGLRSIYNLVLTNTPLYDPVFREVNAIAAYANSLAHDTKVAFKAEWEAMCIVIYRNELRRSLVELTYRARRRNGEMIIGDLLSSENSDIDEDNDDDDAYFEAYNDKQPYDQNSEFNFERYFETTDEEVDDDNDSE